MKTLNLKLKRRFFGEDYTIGSLFIGDTYFCDTLEDKNRDLNKDGDLNDKNEGKVYSKTAIPFGKYRVIVNRSPRFGRELPKLLSVPHFDGILIHRGNTAKDTAGCILVGENKVKGQLVNSTVYERDLVNILKDAIQDNKQVFIEIV